VPAGTLLSAAKKPPNANGVDTLGNFNPESVKRLVKCIKRSSGCINYTSVRDMLDNNAIVGDMDKGVHISYSVYHTLQNL
jgi:hypothetical protein